MRMRLLVLLLGVLALGCPDAQKVSAQRHGGADPDESAELELCHVNATIDAVVVAMNEGGWTAPEERCLVAMWYIDCATGVLSRDGGMSRKRAVDLLTPLAKTECPGTAFTERVHRTLKQQHRPVKRRR